MLVFTMKKQDPMVSLTSVEAMPLFKLMDEEGRERLLRAATRVSFRAGEVVLREGDPGDAMYLVMEGDVRVTTTKDGEQVELALLGDGACIGEVAMLTGLPRTATVVTVTPCEMLCLHKSDVDEILEDYPKVRKLLIAMLQSRAQDAVEKLMGE